MDTIFVSNFPESKSIYGVSIDTVFTVSITLFIFILGLILNRLIENAKKMKHLREVKEFFLTSLTHLLAPMQRQSDSLKACAAQIASDVHQDFTLQETAELYVDPLKSVSQFDVFNALMRGSKKKRPERAKRFNSIVTVLEFIRLQKERTAQHFSDFILAHRRYLQQWNESADGIQRQFYLLLTHARANNIKATDDPFLAGLDKIVHAWSQLPDRRHFTIARTSLLEPIREHCLAHRDDLRTMMFLPLVLNSFNAHDNMKHLKSLYSDSFREQADRLLVKRDQLSQSIDFFTNGIKNASATNA